MNVLKFPCDASRRAHSRKPRRSKNGTPDERAKSVAADEAAPPPSIIIKLPRKRSSLLDQEFKDKLNQLDPLRRRYIEGYMQCLLDQRGKQ
jgi:hypothetical protein